jgi:hypothetical protein
MMYPMYALAMCQGEFNISQIPDEAGPAGQFRME